MRTRTFGLISAAVVVTFVATACGGGVADSGQQAPGGGGSAKADQVYAQIAALPKDQQRAKAVELAKSEGTLSLYTSMTADVADAVSKKFQDQFGIKVSVFRGNSETVLQRTSQESSANRLGADVIESDFPQMTILSSQKLLADYNGAALDKVQQAGKFPDWTATRFNVLLPAWNTNLISPGDEPKSWEDLADPKYRGKLSIEASDSDWYENVTHYWLTHGKTQQQVDQLWQGIVANAKTVKGHTTMAQLLGAGQTGMDAMNYTYITERSKLDGAPVAYRPASGTNPIPAFPRPNGIGMLKAAQHPAAAWLFYDWMLTEGQQVLVSLHLTPSTTVPGDDSFQGVNLVPYDVDTLTKDGATWDTKYDDLLRGVAAN
ncbi:extracellular solute-binding protein [Amycolatopsis acidiphila]|uniref:Extracellular solute-binding protein n=1 Tax=Amycolatopsis acidiphila TaxID=715473 RepID=A0A558AFA8_9PSEU|nr:extracellular solute-binding protein [Amycolatopsis acidiphila]TVT22940.1 extracellular solute-binding protein [Amycolatopsis acidiphila]UIJ57100.1 extracellular solute-binding protein [Amycolatopsis acidiphila]GHG53357.1 iron(III) ABC transporter iron (III)-binding protein [Amycolatopsis acidiphila]